MANGQAVCLISHARRNEGFLERVHVHTSTAGIECKVTCRALDERLLLITPGGKDDDRMKNTSTPFSLMECGFGEASPGVLSSCYLFVQHCFHHLGRGFLIDYNRNLHGHMIWRSLSYSSLYLELTGGFEASYFCNGMALVI